jgi:outer membrane protein assembly factor BamB
VVAGGRLFAGSMNGVLYARDAATGAPLWAFATQGPIRHSAAVHDSTVIVSSYDGYTYALDAASGGLLWKTQTGPSATAPLIDASRQRTVVASTNGRLTSMNLSGGSIAWEFDSGAPILTSPSLSADGSLVLFGNENIQAIAVNASTGSQVWTTPLQGMSLADRYPVVAGSTVMYRSQPVYFFHTLLHEGDSTMDLAGTRSGDWAVDWSAVRTRILSYLSADLTKATFFALNVSNGASRGVVPVLYTYGNNDIPNVPVVRGSTAYVTYRARHGIQTDGGAVHVSSKYDAEVGQLDLSSLDISGLRQAGYPAYEAEFRMTSDEPAMLTMGGNILWVDNWERLGGIDVSTGQLIHVGNVSNTWPECYGGTGCGPAGPNPFFPMSGSGSAYPFPSPRTTEGNQRGGTVIAGDMLYWSVIEGGLAGIAHRAGSSCAAPRVWTSTPGTPSGDYTAPPVQSQARALADYVGLDLTQPAVNPPADVVQQLRAEVQAITSSGAHLMPLYLERGFSEPSVWPYNTSNPPGPPEISFGSNGNAFWHDPGELLYTLAAAYPYLDAAQQAEARVYMSAEMGRYPPLQDLPWSGMPWLKQGTARERYSVPFRSSLNNWPPPAANLSAVYALWLWSKNTGDWSYAQSHWSQATSLFNARRGSMSYYADIAGAIGYARLAQHFGDTVAYQAGVQAAVAGMQAGLDFAAYRDRASNAYLDPRQENSGWSAPVFYGLSPEVGLYLREQTAGQAQSYLLSLENGDGLRWWYLTRAGVHAEVGETSYLSPGTAWSHFLAHAYILGDSQATLTPWLDWPWGKGDLYSIQKLVAALQAGTTGAPIPTPTATLTSTPAATAAPGPIVSNLQVITTNVARYEKFEVQFSLATSASNPDLPYDPSPPAGVPAGTGVTVEGLFSDDNWRTTLVQPAFLYQPYVHTVIGGKDHYTPDGAPRWSVRFAPQSPGAWQFRIRAEDATGAVTYPATTSPALTFSVASTSSNAYIRSGFVRVSADDARYFEFDDGTPFVGVGFNESFSSTADADQKLQRFEANRINFLRVWLSGSSINGSHWSPWSSHHLPSEAYLPGVGLDTQNTYNGADVAWRLDGGNPCLFADFAQGGIPVEPSTSYTVFARVRLSGLAGPATAGAWGFVIKQAGWLGTACDQPNNGTLITTPIQSSSGWTTVTGTYTTGASQSWLDYLYMARQNATGGAVYVDEVRVWRTTDPDQVNLLREPNANSHLTFDPMASARWDGIFDSAAAHGVYIKVVIDEKNEWIRSRIGADGRLTTTSSDSNFYASPDTRGRWLQEAWWRYLAARWGYSTAIHSFEYLNEGDPYNGRHYEAANAMARAFHTLDASRHLATTSFWHSFPNAEFWSNSAYPDIDYADLHAYISSGWGLTAAFIGSSRLETRSAHVRTGNASVHLAGTDNGNEPISPRGLVIHGPGEWIVRYWMKAANFTTSCSFGSSGGMQRVRWLVDGGAYWGGMEGVVPFNSEGKDFLCTSPGGTYDWTAFGSDRDQNGNLIPETFRLILTDSGPHEISLRVENSSGTGGDAWIDDVELISPSGEVVPVIGQFDTTPMDDDTAWFNKAYGDLLGGGSPAGARMPLVRGETGVDSPSQQDWNRDLTRDTAGIWLHNNVWAQAGPGGMYDLFWWATETIPPSLYPNYLAFRNFMDGIPLDNGQYRDARATTSDPNLRAWGQRDDSTGRMHLWIQNRLHTWKRVINGPGIPDISGSITIPNAADGTYQVEWWDTYKTTNPVFLSQQVNVSGGSLVISLPAPLTSDVAVKIQRQGGAGATPTPTASPTPTVEGTGAATATPTPSATPTLGLTGSVTNTPTPTPTGTVMATETPTAPATTTETPATAATPTETPAPAATATETATPATTATETPAPAATATETATPATTATETPAQAATPSSGPLVGDINLDGQVNVIDVQLSVNVFLGTETDSGMVARADVNGDGTVNVIDVQQTANIFLAG